MLPFLTEIVLFVWNRVTRRMDSFLTTSKCFFEIADVFMRNKDSEFIAVLISLFVKIKLVVYIVVYIKMHFKHIGSIWQL